MKPRGGRAVMERTQGRLALSDDDERALYRALQFFPTPPGYYPLQTRDFAAYDEVRPGMPQGLWSLLDMVANFSFVGATQLLGEIGVLIRLASHNKEIEADRKHRIKFGAALAPDPKEEGAFKGTADSVEQILSMTESLQEFMNCSHIADAASRLRYWSERSDKSWNDLFTRSCVLRDAIVTEFKGYLAYLYPQEKGKKFNNWRKEWETALAAFPDIQRDAFCATDCYALGHDVASVFHSMRVAEVGLRALAHERRLKLPKNKPVEWATWQEIIRELDKEIVAIGKKPAGKTKDAALEFYSGARADLNGFKDEYRNAVSHVRATYDEFQALRALTRVREFMERLAEKLSAAHPRIKWGRF